MSMSQRIRRMRQDHPPHRRLTLMPKTDQARQRPAFLKPPAETGAQGAVVDHHLVTQRKRLEDVEPIWLIRWLLRKYFEWRGFACRSHCGECDGTCYASIEYRGTFEDRGAARWAASCSGGEVKSIPFNALLPEETVSYGTTEVPVSEASQFYRQGVALPFMALSREQWAQLEAKVEQVVQSASA